MVFCQASLSVTSWPLWLDTKIAHFNLIVCTNQHTLISFWFSRRWGHFKSIRDLFVKLVALPPTPSSPRVSGLQSVLDAHSFPTTCLNNWRRHQDLFRVSQYPSFLICFCSFLSSSVELQVENKNRDENRASGGRVRGRAGYIHRLGHGRAWG